MRRDWIWLAFALYGSAALWLWLTFDEYAGRLPYVAAAGAALVFGALVYLRANRPGVRFVTLLGSLLLAILIVAWGKWNLVPTQTWPLVIDDGLRWSEIQSSLITGAWLILSILGPPALVRLLPLQRGPSPGTPVSWLHRLRWIWRVIALVLLAVALLGPWWFDRIYVPVQYTCSNSVVRLEGDFCGVPMSGMGLLFILVTASIERLMEGITGAAAPLDLADALPAVLAFTAVALALVLPFLTTLLLIVRGDGRRPQVFHVAAWCLATPAALLVSVVVSKSLLIGALWGSWLYIGVAVGALVLEVAALAGKRGLRRRTIS
jgi:hypothetical protein